MYRIANCGLGVETEVSNDNVTETNTTTYKIHCPNTYNHIRVARKGSIILTMGSFNCLIPVNV